MKKRIEFQSIDENFLLTNGSCSITDIVISKEDEIFCSLSLDFNVASEGVTKEESLENLLEALSDYIDLAIENEIDIYRPVANEDNPLINDTTSIIEVIKIALNIDLELLDTTMYA